MQCPDARHLIGPPIRTIFRQALPGIDEATIESLTDCYRRAYDLEGWRQVSVYPGVLGALGQLNEAGVSCWGVTNKPAAPTRLVLEHCGLHMYFGEFLSIDSRTPPYSSKREATQDLMARHRVIAFDSSICR